jgi:hypothetical protein
MTAVEWLAEELTLPEYGNNPQWVLQVIQQAKEMEKQQIMDAFDECGNYQDNYSDSEHYYRSTFNREEK